MEQRYRDLYLLWNLPQALHTAEQVAAPQHDAPSVINYILSVYSGGYKAVADKHTVPIDGTAKSGKESRAPILMAIKQYRQQCVYLFSRKRNYKLQGSLLLHRRWLIGG